MIKAIICHSFILVLLILFLYPPLQNVDGETALYLACGRDHRGVVNLLVTWKIDVNLQTKNGRSAIFVAAQNNFYDVADALIAAGADLNLQVNCCY